MAAIRGIDISLIGDKDLNRKFKKLPFILEKKILRKAMRDVAKNIFLPSIKSLVPVDTGLLKSNLKVRAIKRSRERVGVFVRTPTREEMGLPLKGKWYYPAIVEYGDVKRGIRPVSYMRLGFSTVKERARRQLGREIGKGIVKSALTGI